MGELHLPRKTMEELDRSFWQSIESERETFLSAAPPQPSASAAAKAPPTGDPHVS